MEQEKRMHSYELQLQEKDRADRLDDINLHIIPPATDQPRETSSAAATAQTGETSLTETPKEYYIGETLWTMDSDGTYRPQKDKDNEDEEDEQHAQDWQADQGYDEYGYYDDDGNYHAWNEDDYDYDWDDTPQDFPQQTLEQDVEHLVTESMAATKTQREQQPPMWYTTPTFEKSNQAQSSALVPSPSTVAKASGETLDSRRTKSNFAAWVTPQ